MKHIHSKLLLLAGISVFLLGFGQSATAGIEVKLIEPKKFVDYEISGHQKKRSIAIIQRDLTFLFEKAAKDYVGEKDNLLIEVTDLDLAGYMEPFFSTTQNEMRIVRNTDFYKLKFQFELKNAAGEVTKKGEKHIKEFLDNHFARLSKPMSSSVGYLEKDIKKWFKEEFSQ